MFSAQRTFTHETEINAPLERVLAILSDRDQYARLNPLVIAVEPNSQDAEGYFVVDTLKMFGQTFRVKYRGQQVTVADGINAQGWSSPNVHIYNEWRCTAIQGKTRVRETSTITTWSFLMNYVFATAEQAHTGLMLNLKQKAEGTQP
jgi:carbon monoxide dehydrogenase subunit G